MHFLARFAGPAVVLLAGLGFELSGFESPVAAVVLWVVAALWGLLALVTWKPVGRFLPTFNIKVSYRPPERRGRRRLRRETLEVVNEIHQHVREGGAPFAQSTDEHWRVTRAMEAVQSEEERDRIWHEYGMNESRRWSEEMQRNLQRFGGKVGYLLGEYERRGLLNPEERSKLAWNLNSNYWIVETASRLEALARKL